MQMENLQFVFRIKSRCFTNYKSLMKGHEKKANGKYAQVQCKQPRNISNSSVTRRREGGWSREKGSKE